ncbi:carboxymuconolactone decarboxylase family protein [Arthrobacter echini]|uniref:Carboxymuconolactone decarboxylase family protein n=1 Tax=Arthrobacter echini TaxID=1529066 RepID=A0A4S5E5M6_9MICC|nr:carboxymuconolactone decarboxylase family protein [Arthrobacter echini]THJ66742.1 carboxymuconolactone decarboxylase family protein [Arthrobacter echini]
MSGSDHFLDKSDPASWRALNGLALKVAESAQQAGLPRSVIELVNVRISQLNGCAFCLDMHVRLAKQAGISDQQLAVLPTWRETAVFSPTEYAALAIGEAATELPDREHLRAELAAAKEALTDEQFSALQWVAVTMNAFNRVSILSGHPVRRRSAEAAGKAAPQKVAVAP